MLACKNKQKIKNKNQIQMWHMYCTVCSLMEQFDFLGKESNEEILTTLMYVNMSSLAWLKSHKICLPEPQRLKWAYFSKSPTIASVVIVSTLSLFIHPHQSLKANASPPHYRSCVCTLRAYDHNFWPRIALDDLNVCIPSMNIYKTTCRQRTSHYMHIKTHRLCNFFFSSFLLWCPWMCHTAAL